MSVPLRRPDDPRLWLDRAKSNLALARSRSDDIYLEDLCFEAQQAAEKAIKAVLIHLDIRFPYVHDLAELLTLLIQRGLHVSEAVKQAARLTRFAVAARYPSVMEPVAKDEYMDALHTATLVVQWASDIIETESR